MAKQKVDTPAEISPVFNPALDSELYQRADSDAGVEDLRSESPDTVRETTPLVPMRRTITGMKPGEVPEPDTYERPSAAAPSVPVKAQADPTIPKSGFIMAPSVVTGISGQAQEAFMSDEERWVNVRPNVTRKCFIGPRIWYFQKDVQLPVPQSVKDVLARANMIYP